MNPFIELPAGDTAAPPFWASASNIEVEKFKQFEGLRFEALRFEALRFEVLGFEILG